MIAVWGRAWVSARGELEAARAAEAAGDVDRALAYHQYAMRWYTPLAAAPREAADALTAIADRAEAAGDRATALAALRRLRGAILATRSLYSPFGDRLPEVNRRLARLTAEEQLALGQPTLRGRDLATLEADHRRLLELDPTPATGWSLVVVLSFVGWVSGAALTIARGLDAEARLVRGPALRWGGFAALCFAAWIAGLALA